MATTPLLPTASPSKAPSLTSTLHDRGYEPSNASSSSTASATLTDTQEIMFDHFDGVSSRQAETYSHQHPHQPRNQMRRGEERRDGKDGNKKQVYKVYRSVAHIGEEEGERVGVDGGEDEYSTRFGSEEDYSGVRVREGGGEGEVVAWAWEGEEWMEGFWGAVLIVVGFAIMVLLVVVLGIALGLGFAWLYGGW